MALEVMAAAYGAEADDALRAAVARLKRDDALQPVAVVVPANSVGVAARRMLARTNSGIAGLTLLTIYRLAELLGAPTLAAQARRPVSTPVLGAMVREVLRRQPGLFAAAVEHPSTEEALVRAHQELSDLDDTELRTLAATGERAAEVVRVHHGVRGLVTPDWFEERDLLDAAAGVVAEGSPILDDLGALVVHLPQHISAPAARLLRAAAERSSVVVIAGLTGVADADQEVLESLRRLGAEPPTADITPPTGTGIVSVSDGDEEVRHVVRRIVEAARAGTPLDRMAVVFASEEPYARLTHEHLAAAGVAHNVGAVRAPADGLLGRSLLALLALPDHQFRRDEVFALLSASPIRTPAGEWVPAARWNRISREAGVVRGVHEWQHRLEVHAGALDDRGHTERATRSRALAAFIARLAADLAPPDAPTSGPTSGPTWAALARWCQGIVHTYLGDERRRARWPEHEIRLAEQVDATLDRLASLDAVESQPSLDVFRRTLELELRTADGRIGRLGEGVMVGPASMAVGLDLDLVFVLGLAEGWFPASPRDDSLLPDDDRASVAGALRLRAGRVERQHRAFLAAIASSRGERVLCFPRGDLRRSTEHVPSRFLLDTVEALTGERPSTEELARLRGDSLVHVASFVGGLTGAPAPATITDFDLRTLLGHEAGGAPIDTHPLATSERELALGLACTRARQSDRFTRFDGNLAGLPVVSPLDEGQLVSATRLETYADSPFEYLMERVLHVEIPERPEQILAISALDRGSLVHEALDRFITEVVTRAEGAPKPDAAWSAADRARLLAIAEEECDAVEHRGLTGHALLWKRDRAEILRDLERWLTEDDIRREEYALVPCAAELRFGFDDSAPPVEITLPNGRCVRFRGSIDRVDRIVDGDDVGGLCVVDYKTGRVRNFTNLSQDDPDNCGTKLQLPVYGAAARAAFPDATGPIVSEYWFVSATARFQCIGFTVTPEVDARISEVVATIVDGITAGVFPCRVDPPDTSPFHWVTYADPDRLGTRDRYREWQRKCTDPALAGYMALAEPDLVDDDGVVQLALVLDS